MELHLAETQTGTRTVSLSLPGRTGARRHFARRGQPLGDTEGWRKGERLCYIDCSGRLVRERANLEDVGIHDCRRSIASRAPALGESLPANSKLLGSTHVETAARNAHLARDSMLEAGARVADSIGADIHQRGRVDNP